jgi:dTDP-4-amino-4,6-dideoxygalactose transaminase
MELQGAVGLVQLRKLDEALKQQRENKARLKDALRGLRTIRFREFADEAGETGDTLVFFLENPKVASRAAQRLFERGIRFKILPEATQWHFAGTWGHIFSAVKGYRRKDPGKLWRRSGDLLRSAIAIPIFIKMDEDRIQQTVSAIREVLGRI